MNRSDWFKGKKWGLFTHFLAAPASSALGAETSAEEWNKRVNMFDVDLLAKDLIETGADFCCITIGQNSGHYCAPNATYDRLTGITPTKCSGRDLVGDLADRLENEGIDVLVYTPAGAPAAEPQAITTLKWEWGYEGEWPTSPCTVRTMKRLAEFQLNWEAVLRDWSLRWGNRVKGWWVDVCYFSEEMYNHPDSPNFKSFTDAMRAGNPDAVIALNTGLDTPFEILSDYDDYTAGEVGYSLPLAIGWDDSIEAFNKKIKSKQLNVLSYLGRTWGQGSPRFSDELVIGYTKYILAKGGIFMWDIPLQANGSMPGDYKKQLIKLSESLK